MADPPQNILSGLSPEDRLKKLENIEMRLSVEAGSTNLTVRDLLKLNVGSVVELDTEAGAHLVVKANGTPVLKGEIVTIGQSLGIRMTQVISEEEKSKDQK